MTSVTTDQRQGINSGAAIKVSCIAASTGNLTLSGAQTVDGISLVADDRCFAKDQTDASEIGIYVVKNGAWERAPDWGGAYDVVEGTIIPVSRGTTNANTFWRVTNTGDITIGTTDITVSRFLILLINSSGVPNIGAGLSGATANTDADNFIVETPGTGGLSLLSPDASYSQVYFGSPSDSVGALIFWSYDANDFAIGTHKPGGFFRFLSGNGTNAMRIDPSQNLLLGGTATPTGASGVLVLSSKTLGSAQADTVQITSEDLSAGNTIPSIRTEGGGIFSAGTPAAASGSIAIKVDGTVRYFYVSDTPAS